MVENRQAKNRQLEIDAAEIRIRAERRVGELIAAQRDTEGLNLGASAGGKKDGPRGSVVDPRDTRPTLAEAGIDKHLADRARKLAAVPASEFESDLNEWRGRGEQTGGVMEDRQKTVNRDDDGRLRTGARLLFNRKTEREAYYAAKALRRLSPQQCRRLRQVIEQVITARAEAEGLALIAIAPFVMAIDTMSVDQRIDLLRQLQAELPEDETGSLPPTG